MNTSGRILAYFYALHSSSIGITLDTLNSSKLNVGNRLDCERLAAWWFRSLTLNNSR